ncbi:hypothetical protein [Mycobacterium asiaticum]|uniref:phage terminase small subunit n=1 Tax=Mycobacterium asiaticum TaxID=1790 RepID=UPI0007EF1E83|nr:hypothetical protein [Mycobacterium asiaticum]OBJ60247.1 hypothetical protein A9W94_13865 [Mycobacterium asiaticum]
MTVSKPRGPAPKRESQRRRANKPESHGEAQPVVAGTASEQPAELGFAAHPLIVDMWNALGGSVEAKFFSAADWQRARLELWFANKLVRQRKAISAPAWAAVQAGLSELLVSPADKRRAGIELKKAAADPDEEAAVVQLAQYQAALSSA